MSKKRSHVPALNKLELAAALQRVNELPVSKRGKLALAQILAAAANPDAESPDVVIETLKGERQSNVKSTREAVDRLSASTVKRGSGALANMSAEEWDRLINESDG